MEKSFDLIVVGFGKAGKTIAMKRATAGDSVALIERDPTMYGGTCINIGCVPTKKLLFETASGADFPAAVEARDTLIGTLNAANLKLAEDAGVTVITGDARFLAAKEISVSAGDDELRLTADRVIINTGSAPNWPDIPGIDSPRVYDSTSIQHITPTPRHLAIVGGGPIGLEFATLFSGQGARVTVLDSGDRPLGAFDQDVAALGADLLRERGVDIVTGARVSGFSDTGSGLEVSYGEEKTLVDAALVAIGRHPATAGLGLEDAGIEVGERGEVVVDTHLRTSVDGVWAVGDVTGGPQFTYISYDDHRIVLAQLADREGHSTDERIFPTTTFLEPPLSTIGLGEQEAIDAGYDIEVRQGLIKDMPIVPRPKIVGETDGMAKFIVDTQTGLILGATLFCVDSQELINTVAVAMRHGVSAAELGDGIYTHPSTSEVFNQVLG
ncbi:FAD-dependent oxidoreductase [Corynebacterium doosanense]|uniref:Pyridine nucleotide-disulfide oxidoreductase n=1 Tax=Corynebacterium doosanense CAU 212 = DSM 45436 TaxID=558173 RepID=A0A097IIY4_9CORY|nr:FAD-dependent oxidoreductase [Corynebacterium doosanense]AIT62090.1 pyridine nucleotide-disulfide oxidoreductase [Corynebacterium doosanense CAU 212 = DSM 45436]